MAIRDIFSKRQRRARGEFPDVYQYTDIAQTFRTQVVHILSDLLRDISPVRGDVTDSHFKTLHDHLCREYGLMSLSPEFDPRVKYAASWQGNVFDFLLKTPDVERVLDVVEVGMAVGTEVYSQAVRNYREPAITLDAAVAELNHRFQEHGIGFQYENDRIIRVDSQILHTETVKPALQLLFQPAFAGANGEFLKAHEHYRHGRYGESMNESLKSFESTLKVICKQRKYPHKDTDTASTLINAVFTGGLIPPWLQSEFAGLRSVLEAGVPTARNKMSGHGSGEQPKEIPVEMAAYLLHMTASAIVFLVHTHQNTR